MKNKLPFVSVLMPVYNNEETVAEAIRSIQDQTFEDFEFIIIDDGSTDNTVEVIKAFLTDSRIRFYSYDKNRGLPKMLNQGIFMCQGKYIARMDGDDFSFADRLQVQVEFLERNSDCLVVGSAYILEIDGVDRGARKQVCSHTGLITKLMFGNNICHPSVMIRKDMLIASGEFYDERLLYVQDYELWTRLITRYRIENMPTPLIIYRGASPRGMVKNDISRENFQKVRVDYIQKILKISSNDAEVVSVFFKWPERLGLIILFQTYFRCCGFIFGRNQFDRLQFFLRVQYSLLKGFIRK